MDRPRTIIRRRFVDVVGQDFYDGLRDHRLKGGHICPATVDRLTDRALTMVREAITAAAYLADLEEDQ